GAEILAAGVLVDPAEPAGPLLPPLAVLRPLVDEEGALEDRAQEIEQQVLGDALVRRQRLAGDVRLAPDDADARLRQRRADELEILLLHLLVEIPLALFARALAVAAPEPDGDRHAEDGDQ